VTRRRRAPRPTAPRAPRLSVGDVRDLGADLVRDLAPHATDPDAVNAVLRDWFAHEDVTRLGLICMAAVQLIFTDCLNPVPASEAPPGALALTAPPEGAHREH